VHHHTREQADFGISGTFDVTLGSHVESVGAGAGFIIPADVMHSIANRQGGVAIIIEFHTVRRPDLVPPRPAMTSAVRMRAAGTAEAVIVEFSPAPSSS
jgi:quercetin dioxygenase-like cupin family protein